MSQPSNVSISIDGMSFNAYSSHLGIATLHDHTGMPQMGQQQFQISAAVDANDTQNMSFDKLKTLFQLANSPTKEKIKPIKISFWADDGQTNAIAVFSFDGWISNLSITGGGGSNHELSFSLVPKLGKTNYVDMQIGN